MPISVLTLNLWHDAGPYARRAAQIRSWIARLDPDLIGFQEALRGPEFDQAAELLDGLGYHLDYVEATRWQNGEISFGNAAASRWPILGRDTLQLPASDEGEQRAALSITVEAPPGPISFTTTHLNWRFHHGVVRERQVIALCDWVRARRPLRGFPPILVGDFNAEPDSAEIRYVTGLQSLEGRGVYFADAWRVAGEEGSGITWSNANDHAREWQEPDRRIDYIFAGPPRGDGLGRLLRCQVVCDQANDGVWPSDHFGVYAELRSEPIPELAHRA